MRNGQSAYARVKHAVLTLAVVVLIADLVALNVIILQVTPDDRVEQHPDWGRAGREGEIFRLSSLVWQTRLEALVPGRPDLTGPLTDEQVVSRTEHVSRFFESAGVDRERVENLRFACTTMHTVISFKLGLSDAARLVEGTTALDPPAEVLLDDLYSSGAISISGPGPRDSRTYMLDSLTQYPFILLDWWPAPPQVTTGMHAYLGEMTWDFGDMDAGHDYFVFINDKGRGYIVM